MNPLITSDQNNINSPIIVGLDFDNEKKVMELVSKLDPSLCKLKVGKELFTNCGPKLIEKLAVSGYDVFLDLKFHDIPNTVYKACMAAANLGVWMVNVHASGGGNMLQMARQAIDESSHKPLLIAVTVLTSMSEADLAQIGINNDINTQVLRLAKLSYECGLDGVVASAHEAKIIKNVTSSQFLTITPGIRLASDKSHDQVRIMTPVTALNNLADYLVIGRSITTAIDPHTTLLQILADIKTSHST
jgi:orotidine-5'-phosphate decarboxylase